MFRTIPVLLLLLIPAIGCGAPKTEKDLVGTWELSYRNISNQLMGPMGKDFYEKTYSRMNTHLMFMDDGQFILAYGSKTEVSKQLQAATETGNWELLESSGSTLTLSLTKDGKTEKVLLKFDAADSFHMSAGGKAPKMICNVPTDYLLFQKSGQ